MNDLTRYTVGNALRWLKKIVVIDSEGETLAAALHLLEQCNE